LSSIQIWSGNSNNTPSTIAFTDTVANRQIANGSTATLALNFDLTLAAGNYNLTANFDGCTASQSGTLP